MAINKNLPSLEDLLVAQFTVGRDSVDRAAYYTLTSGFDGDALRSLEDRVRRGIDAFYAGSGLSGEELVKKRRISEKLAKSWFRPWTRLAGRVEAGLGELVASRGRELDEKDFGNLMARFMGLPEYGPYLESHFKGFVYNRCTELFLDYSKLPDSLRSPVLDAKFAEDFPFCIDGKESVFLDLAYNMGARRDMVLGEEPSSRNGYIGGALTWDRFVPMFGPVVDGNRVLGLGFIDYKDCTNAYVVLNEYQKAVPFDSLDGFSRRGIMERVFIRDRYGSREDRSQGHRQEDGNVRMSKKEPKGSLKVFRKPGL